MFCLVRAPVSEDRDGRSTFHQVDPVEGGSCNDYDYTCGDPINGLDLSGMTASWTDDLSWLQWLSPEDATRILDIAMTVDALSAAGVEVDMSTLRYVREDDLGPSQAVFYSTWGIRLPHLDCPFGSYPDGGCRGGSINGANRNGAREGAIAGAAGCAGGASLAWWSGGGALGACVGAGAVAGVSGYVHGFLDRLW